MTESITETPADDPTDNSSTDQLLATDDLTKKFRNVAAVDGVSWSIGAGKIHAVIGPNGAGKSTFFNLLSGILQPTSGRLWFDGENITGLGPNNVARRGLVKTSQITNIFEEVTVFENIAWAAQAHESVYNFYSKAAGSAADRYAQEVIGSLGLEEVQDEEAGTLSHGDQRKIELGLAMATDAKVLLLDEPTAGMATDETAQMLDLLKGLAEQEMTILITEHDIELVLALSDDITVLNQGSVIARGDPEEITRDDRVQRVYLGK